MEFAPPLVEGQRIFRHYQLKRFLGRGPLGAAWLARHEGMDRDLAMRFLPDLWLRDERVLSALRAGVVRLLELTHANLVRVFDFLRDDQCAAVVTEFVDGEPLQDLKVQQEQRCFEVEMLRPLIAQLCDVLDYTHRYHDAVHGDLTPANLLITHRGELKVGDFGLVRSLFDVIENEDTGTVAGTLAYISPERARGQPSEVADDIYGFGATLYDLLTSRPPFFRGNILLQIENAAPPSMAERRAEFEISGQPIPPEWEEVVAACLAKKPEDRPQSIEEVGVRLGLMERQTPRPARPVAPPAPPPGPRVEYPTGVETMSMPARPEDATIRAGNESPAPRPAPIHVGGRIFQRFTLQREIGRGLTSVVWLATDEEFQRPVALKLLPDVILHDREAVNELKLEAERARQLDHPHIVRQFDFVHDPHGAAIIMEFVDGEAVDTMKAARDGAPWNPSEIASWLTQLCAALDHAHQVARLVHRDVKPANLLVARSGDLKLTGFGTSRSLSDSMTRVSLTSTGGSLAYLSPEQALGAAPSAADDIYAFGATAYELLTGRPPFFRGNLLHQLNTALPPPIGERRAELGHAGEPIPPSWEEVIQACLAKRSQDRPANMREVAERLAARGVETPNPSAPAAAADLDAEQSRTTIRRMIASPKPEAEPGTILQPAELRAVIRKMIGSPAPAASAVDSKTPGQLAPDELRTVIRQMIGEPPSTPQPAPEKALGPDELRSVITKLAASGSASEAANIAKPSQISSPEELRATIRKMVGLTEDQKRSGPLAPEELRAVIRQMISGGEATAPVPPVQPLGGEELRGVIRSVIAGDSVSKPASGALQREELRAVIAKMETPGAAASPADAARPAPEKVLTVASAQPAAASAVAKSESRLSQTAEPRERPGEKPPPGSPLRVSAPAAAPAAPAKAPPAPAPPQRAEIAARRGTTLETTASAVPPPAPPPSEPKTVPSSAIETTSPPRKMPEQKPAMPPRPAAVARMEGAGSVVPPPLPPAGSAPAASSPPVDSARRGAQPAASNQSAASVPPPPSPFPTGRRTVLLVSAAAIAALAVGTALFFAVTKLRRNQPVAQTGSGAVEQPSTQPPEATPAPQPPLAQRTVTVQELSNLAGQPPLREAVYLVGDFIATSSQASTAILRPDAGKSGPLARQIRIVADYPENAMPPREGETVTWTAATRCLIRAVRRGNDGQINVELVVGGRTTG